MVVDNYESIQSCHCEPAGSKRGNLISYPQHSLLQRSNKCDKRRNIKTISVRQK